MKILHIINNLNSGGAEKLMEQTLPLLNKIEGLTVDVLLLTDKNNVFENTLIQKNVEVQIVKYKNIYDPRNIIEIKKYIVNGNYDIIHSHLFPTQYWVALVSWILKGKNIRFITTEHSNHNRRRDKRYFRFLEKFIYFNYDNVVCITDKVCKNLLDWINPKKKDIDKFCVINNGVNIDTFKKALPYPKDKIEKNFTEDTKLITMVGRFTEAKDQDTLIKAIAILPKNIHLILIGEGPLKHRVRSLAREIGVLDRVHFLGFRNDIERILKTTDIIVLSSHWEGLSLASIEAMASGRPFIASRVQGLEDIVDGYGLLFEQGNYEDLSKIINNLLSDKVFYKEIVYKCLKRAEDFNIDKMIDSMLSLYRK